MARALGGASALAALVALRPTRRRHAARRIVYTIGQGGCDARFDDVVLNP
jgi:hypothetical protein